MLIDILLYIFRYHPSLQNSTSLCFPPVLLFQVPFQYSIWSFVSNVTKPPTNPIRPVIMDNARSLRLTAAAGTKLAGAYSQKFMSWCNFSQNFTTTRSLHHSRSIAGSRFSTLSNIPHCWPQKKPGPCLSPSVAVRPLRPTKNQRLGKLLPYQQPNLV